MKTWTVPEKFNVPYGERGIFKSLDRGERIGWNSPYFAVGTYTPAGIKEEYRIAGQAARFLMYKFTSESDDQKLLVDNAKKLVIIRHECDVLDRARRSLVEDFQHFEFCAPKSPRVPESVIDPVRGKTGTVVRDTVREYKKSDQYLRIVSDAHASAHQMQMASYIFEKGKYDACVEPARRSSAYIDICRQIEDCKIRIESVKADMLRIESELDECHAALLALGLAVIKSFKNYSSSYGNGPDTGSRIF